MGVKQGFGDRLKNESSRGVSLYFTLASKSTRETKSTLVLANIKFLSFLENGNCSFEILCQGNLVNRYVNDLFHCVGGSFHVHFLRKNKVLKTVNIAHTKK